MKTHAKASHLWGDFFVITSQRPKITTRRKTEESQLTSEEEKRWKKDLKAKAVSRRVRQKEAEVIQSTGDGKQMSRIVKMNNAALGHLVRFVQIVQYAEDREFPIALGEMRKTVAETEVANEWRMIRRWLARYAPPFCLVSIGRRPRGRWVLRWAILGNDTMEDIFKIAAPTILYLARRGWRTEDAAMNAKAAKLKEHYLSRCGSDEETLELYVSEMFEVYRAALTLPATRRTFRTTETQNILETLLVPVASQAAYVVNSPFEGSKSGVALCKAAVRNGRVVGSYWICQPHETLENEEFDYQNPIVDSQEGGGKMT